MRQIQIEGRLTNGKDQHESNSDVKAPAIAFALNIRTLEPLTKVTLSTMYNSTDTYANSIDPDEMAHNEPSHQDLHCLPFCFDFSLTSIFATMDTSQFNDRKN